MTREEATFNGDGGALTTTTAYQPWHSAGTADQARTGLSTLHATPTNRPLIAAAPAATGNADIWATTSTGQLMLHSDLGSGAMVGTGGWSDLGSLS